MKSLMAARLLICLMATLLVGGTTGGKTTGDKTTGPVDRSVHFQSVDLFVDPHGDKLAAYQIEFNGESDDVKLVGIEGGEHAAFNNPPYYDQKALMQNHVILAALNAGDDLPSRRTRVARLHLEITGDTPKFSTNLIVAATSDGSHIAADASVEEGVKP